MFRHKGKSRTFLHNLRLATMLSFVAGMVNITGVLALQTLTTNVTGPRLAYKKTLRASLVLAACWLASALGNGGDTIEIYARRQ